MIPYVSPYTENPLTEEDSALKSQAGEIFPIVNNIPRFVEKDSYANAFGLQWKTFAQTQLDSYNGTNITRERLERCLGFNLSELSGKDILEVGCGAGRFTELLLEGGGNVHSVDLSAAVDVNRENMGPRSNHTIAQANVYHLPFPKNSFDVVVCLGVVQHTPSSEKTIKALWAMVKPGGLLVIDHYKWRINYYSTLTPIYRAFLKELKPEKSQKIVNALVDFFFPLHWKLRKNKTLNWLIHRISPLIVYFKDFPELDYQFHYEWSKLDTYDQLTDYYKHLKTPKQIEQILKHIGASAIWIHEGGNGVEARGRK
jgi:2-polyprenyl-3-methyl-5-hydroxy-6-metoxy-1,4-benzoquinol methylase